MKLNKSNQTTILKTINKMQGKLQTMTETPLFDFLPKKSSIEKNQLTTEKSGKKNFTH
jgi:hypothetical protein